VTLFDGSGDQIWTVEETAAVLDYSEECIGELAKARLLPSFWFGGERFFSKAELEGWFLRLKPIVEKVL
jgi:hypothetical protein